MHNQKKIGHRRTSSVGSRGLIGLIPRTNGISLKDVVKKKSKSGIICSPRAQNAQSSQNGK